MNTDYVIQSEGGKAMYKVATMVIGMLLTALLTVITIQLGGIKSQGATNSQINSRQDKTLIQNTGEIGYLGRRVDALERLTTAQVATLQAISERLAEIDAERNRK